MKTVLILFMVFFLIPSITLSQKFSWRQLPNSPEALGRFEDIYFINSNTGWLIGNFGKIYKTVNGGNTWTITDTLPSSALRSITFTTESKGWVGTLNQNSVLYQTTDGGFSWTGVNLPVPRPQGICGLYALNENFIFGCGRYDGYSNFIKSTDGGNTWTTKDMKQYATSLVDCYFFNQDSGIVVGSLALFPKLNKSIVLFTSDGGSSWTNKFTGNRLNEVGWKISFPNRQNGFVSLERYGYPERHFIKTTNGGESWTDPSYPSNLSEQGIGFINANIGWIGGYSNSTYGTSDGGSTWFNSNIGMNINRFRFFGDTTGYACGRYVYKYSRTVSISQISTLLADYFLQQNYPNPFNPITKIKFNIPSDAKRETRDVSLKIFDILGKEVTTIVDQKLTQGSYEVDFDGSNLASGVYFYKLVTEEFIETKRMLLSK